MHQGRTALSWTMAFGTALGLAAGACGSFSDGGVSPIETEGGADGAGLPGPEGGVNDASDGDATLADAATPPDAAATDGGGGRLVAFVTAVGYADATTVASADTKCQAEAAGRLPGKFVAWMSSATVPAPKRLVDAKNMAVNGPWFRPDGERIVASRAALLATATTPLENPISRTATNMKGVSSVWTHTLPDGTTGRLCPGTTPTAGRADSVDTQWTEQTAFGTTCGASLGLYCFQVE